MGVVCAHFHRSTFAPLLFLSFFIIRRHSFVALVYFFVFCFDSQTSSPCVFFFGVVQLPYFWVSSFLLFLLWRYWKSFQVKTTFFRLSSRIHRIKRWKIEQLLEGLRFLFRASDRRSASCRSGQRDSADVTSDRRSPACCSFQSN